MNQSVGQYLVEILIRSDSNSTFFCNRFFFTLRLLKISWTHTGRTLSSARNSGIVKEKSQPSQKIKIMFPVFQVVSLDFSRNSFKPLLGIFLSPKAFIYGESSILSLYQVLDPIQGGDAWNFSKSQSLYGSRAQNFSKSQGI